MRGFENTIMDMAAKKKVYEGLSPVALHPGDEIQTDEKGNGYGFAVVVFAVRVVDDFWWWYATEKKAEPEGPCDSEFMESIST